MMRNYIVVGIIAFSTLIGADAIAEIYKFKNVRGEWEYSTTPPANTNYKPTGIQDTYTPGIPMPQSPEQNYRQQSRSAANTNAIYAETDGAPYQQCMETKKRAVAAEKRRLTVQAEKLNEWLWKNCRVYSNEMRTIEQQMM